MTGEAAEPLPQVDAGSSTDGAEDRDKDNADASGANNVEPAWTPHENDRWNDGNWWRYHTQDVIDVDSWHMAWLFPKRACERLALGFVE